MLKVGNLLNKGIRFAGYLIASKGIYILEKLHLKNGIVKQFG